MAAPVRLGDSTSHGGSVTSAASQCEVMGIMVALVGDTCSCPLHNNVTIVQGDSTWTIDGIPVALNGHKTSCGATLIASVTNVDRG